LAIICAVGENLRSDSTLFARAVTSLDGFHCAWSRSRPRECHLVLRDADVPHAMMRLHETSLLRQDDEVTVGRPWQGWETGGDAGSAVWREIAGMIDPMSPLHGGVPTRRRGTGSVAIDFSTPDSVVSNATVLGQARLNLVIGTTGWGAREADASRGGRRRCIGIVVRAEFSTGSLLFRGAGSVCREAVRPQQDFASFLHERIMRRRRTRRRAPRCC